MLFKVYLEEALSTSAKLSEMRKRGDLLAFADDMLVLTNSKVELGEAIRELESLNRGWHLTLNKAKSQVLTKEKEAEIEGIPCMQQVKYLGVPVHVNPKQQSDLCVASIKRNLNHLRWKLKGVEVAIKEMLTCVLARSILVYVGTPMVAAGRWKQEDIERIERQLYREVHGTPNTVSNQALMKVTSTIRPAWEVVQILARRASLQGNYQKEIQTRSEERHLVPSQK